MSQKLIQDVFKNIWNSIESIFYSIVEGVKALTPETRSALIGMFAALAVAWIQDWQERDRSADEQNEKEQNQMKYLYYPMQNTQFFVTV